MAPVGEPEALEFGAVKNVQDAVGVLITAALTPTQIQRWIHDAERQVRRRYRNLDSLIAKEDVDPKDVALVVENAAIRVARNPDGFRQFGIDNGQSTRDTVLSDGQVKILPDEWDLILPPPVVAIQGAYSVRLGTPC